jgi:hypothetical protein
MSYPITFVTRRDKMECAELLGTSVEVVEAVTQVEARGDGFLTSTSWPVILFEGHWFHRNTGGRFSGEHPTLSHKSWTKAHYRGGRREYDRLVHAVALCGDDPAPALKSASWGMFQIMGFNHEPAGFDDVTAFVNAMATGERAHLMAFARFVMADGAMAEALRGQDWRGFARRYNGAGFAKNQYDTKLAAAFARARRKAEEGDESDPGQERNAIVALQAALNAATGARLSVDGWIGAKTRGAIESFQGEAGLPRTGDPDPETVAALGLEGDYAFAMRGGD